MQRIQPARPKPGVASEHIAAPPTRDAVHSTARIRGTALIFWDLKVLGKKKKLDASRRTR